VAREPDNDNPSWASTTAVREPLERVERSWRGIAMDTYALEKITNWTPELSPPLDSPLFRWRVLAGDVAPLRGGDERQVSLPLLLLTCSIRNAFNGKLW
jgi:hypothetical protein